MDEHAATAPVRLRDPNPHRAGPATIVAPAIGTFAIGIDMFVVAGLLGGLVVDLGVTIGVGGLTVSAFTLSYALGAPLLGAALAGRAPRHLLIGSLAAFGLCSLVAAAAPTIAVLLTARVVGGMAAAVYGPAAAAFAVAARPSSRRGRTLGVLQVSASIAMAVGAPLGLLLAGTLSWRAAFVLVTVVAVVALVGLLRSGTGSVTRIGSSLHERLAPVRSASVVCSLGGTLLVMAASNSMFSYLGVLLRPAADGIGLWLFVAAFGAGGVVGTWCGGSAADRWGGARVLLAAGAVLVAGLAVLPRTTSTREWALAVLVTWGVAAWAFVPGQQHRLLGWGTGPAHLLLALNSSAIQLGFAAGALFGGVVVDTAGAGWLWVPAVCCGAAGLLVHAVVPVFAAQVGQ